MYQKRRALACAVCLTLALTIPQARAAELPKVNYSGSSAVMMLNPRYTYLSRISASLTMSNLGRAGCGGTFNTYHESDARITMDLQQDKDGKWVTIKTWSDEYTNVTRGALDKGYYVDSGHRYRITVTVDILDSDGEVLETVSCDSPIKEY